MKMTVRGKARISMAFYHWSLTVGNLMKLIFICRIETIETVGIIAEKLSENTLTVGRSILILTTSIEFQLKTVHFVNVSLLVGHPAVANLPPISADQSTVFTCVVELGQKPLIDVRFESLLLMELALTRNLGPNQIDHQLLNDSEASNELTVSRSC
jgi:hypothetical protein